MIFNTVIASAGEPPVSYTVTCTDCNTGTWNGSTFTQTNQSEYYEGDTVYVRFASKKTALVTTPTLTTTNVANPSGYHIYSFVMPSANVTAVATTSGPK